MGSYATPPTLRQGAAETVLEPATAKEGHWVGAPCVHDYEGRRLLAVRERTAAERGHTVRIYEVGESLLEVCALTAEDLGVVSVERPALANDPRTGELVLYVPVDHGANEWTIQRLDAVQEPERLDPTTARNVLTPTAGTTDSVTVKDPYVLTVGGRYYMFYAGHDGVSEQAHLATSVDGEQFERAGRVIERQYWHDHHTRVSCVVPAPAAPAWMVFYEGSGHTDYGETWNLRTALATSRDLRDVVDTSPDGPLYSSPVADARTGVDRFATLRYLDVVPTRDDAGSGADTPGEADGDVASEAYYEVAREDGAFELRRAPLDHE